MEKKKNPTVLALKQLVRTYPRINLRGQSAAGPACSDPFIFQFEGHTEGKTPRIDHSVSLSGIVHGGYADATETLQGSYGPYQKYTKGYRPTEGFWYLFSAEERIRSAVESLPDDAEVSVDVWLDGGTHDLLVAARLHADHLILRAEWLRGKRTYYREFLLDVNCVLARENLRVRLHQGAKTYQSRSFGEASSPCLARTKLRKGFDPEREKKVDYKTQEIASLKVERAYTAHASIYIPEREIREKDPTHVYVPLRGYSAVMAVFDLDDCCIGWINVSVLGYSSVKDWMAGTDWKDQGY